MKISRLTAILAVGVFALMPFATGSASAARPEVGPTDFVTVDAAVVNRLGGVSITGSVGCEGTAALVRSGQFYADDGSGGQYLVPAPAPGDVLIILTNADNYTVSQPVGRRLMVQATHGSSRANPCYLYPDSVTLPDGNVLYAEEDGRYTWTTDRYGYDHAQGPLFDYSPDGKFVANKLSVEGIVVGAWIMIEHEGEWTVHDAEFGIDLSYARVLKATMVR